MRCRIVVILIALLLVGVACGVPRTGNFSPIDADKIPDQLTQTTTTTTTIAPTTTTTTILTSTTAGEEISTTSTTMPPTTTIVANELVRLYFLAGGQIVPVEQALSTPITVSKALQALKVGPQGESAVGYRTAVPDLPTQQSKNRLGVVNIDLDAAFFDDITDLADQRLAIAQIVLTLTELKGVAQVTFSQNGQPLQVFLVDGSLSTPGQILVNDDYISLLADTPTAVTEPTTTIAVAPEATSTTLAG